MSSTQEFREKVLNQHNMYRKKHSAPPLVLCEKLCSSAEQRANELADLDRMEHKSGVGENLFKSAEIKLSGKKVVDAWYSEIKYYNFDILCHFHELRTIGHFAQVVWKASHRLGVGFAVAKNGTNYVVCYYDPKGNEEKQYHNNVLKPYS